MGTLVSDLSYQIDVAVEYNDFIYSIMFTYFSLCLFVFNGIE